MIAQIDADIQELKNAFKKAIEYNPDI